MTIKLTEEWKSLLDEEFGKSYFNSLITKIAGEYAGGICYPLPDDIFAAFNRCSFTDIKVVIIGQDPYHGPGQAHGLAFSVNDGIKHPPSLVNIFKEVEADTARPAPKSGNLNRWADQGVLLLNATLTVRHASPGSHQKLGWEIFTDAVIRIISDRLENVVFLLWGGYARSKAKLIDGKKHLILESGHPSPLSANRGMWFGNKHFSKTNTFLVSKGKDEIKW
jgi:uracil-DNA glycosylase